MTQLWNGKMASDQRPMPLSELVLDRQHAGGLVDTSEDMESVISPEFQFIFDSRQGSSLYNWQKDPQEEDNLLLEPRYESVSRALAANLKRN